MGHSHAACSAAAWVSVTSSTPLSLGWYPLPPAAVVGGALLAAGAGVLADADTPTGCIAHALPGITAGRVTVVPSPTELLCRWLGWLAGGHRHGTHWPVTAGAVVLVSWLLVALPQTVLLGRAVELSGAVMAAPLIAFACHVLRLGPRHWWSRWGCALLGGAGLGWLLPPDWGWFPLVVAVGMGTHLVGDAATRGGIPLCGPWYPQRPKVLSTHPWLDRLGRAVWSDNGFIAVPVLGRTGSIREHVLVVGVVGYAGYVAYVMFSAGAAPVGF